MGSWLGRIAARYDCDPAELVASLWPDHPANSIYFNFSDLDFIPCRTFHQLLADEARLDLLELDKLYAAHSDQFATPFWRRHWPTWCEQCVADDMATYGETYDRVYWRLASYAVCRRHGVILVDSCWICRDTGAFTAIDGHQRLVCSSCRQPLDTLCLRRKEAGEFVKNQEALEPSATSHTALYLQDRISDAFGNSDIRWLTDVELSPRAFNQLVHVFCAIIDTLASDKTILPYDQIPIVYENSLACFGPRKVRKRLEDISVILRHVIPGFEPPESSSAALFEHRRVVENELEWLIGRLVPEKGKWLRDVATEWSGPVGETLLRALTDVEARQARARAAREVERRDAEIARDKARLEARWAERETRLVVAAARRRIKARQHKRILAK